MDASCESAKSARITQCVGRRAPNGECILQVILCEPVALKDNLAELLSKSYSVEVVRAPKPSKKASSIECDSWSTEQEFSFWTDSYEIQTKAVKFVQPKDVNKLTATVPTDFEVRFSRCRSDAFQLIHLYFAFPMLTKLIERKKYGGQNEMVAGEKELAKLLSESSKIVVKKDRIQSTEFDSWLLRLFPSFLPELKKLKIEIEHLCVLSALPSKVEKLCALPGYECRSRGRMKVQFPFELLNVKVLKIALDEYFIDVDRCTCASCPMSSKTGKNVHLPNLRKLTLRCGFLNVNCTLHCPSLEEAFVPDAKVFSWLSAPKLKVLHVGFPMDCGGYPENLRAIRDRFPEVHTVYLTSVESIYGHCGKWKLPDSPFTCAINFTLKVFTAQSSYPRKPHTEFGFGGGKTEITEELLKYCEFGSLVGS